MLTLLLAASYMWTPVLVPGKNVVSQFGINDRGEVAVTTDDGTTGIWRHGHFTPLPPPPCACALTAVAKNDAGTVVGVSQPTDGTFTETGFILRGTAYTFFTIPGFDNTEPRGIGNHGLVTVFAWNNDFVENGGFVYDPATGTSTLVTPPGSAYPSIVQGINRFGRVAGNAISTGPRRIFGLVVQPGPAEAFGDTQLPFSLQFRVQDTQTRARGINDFGVLAGFLQSPAGVFSAYVGSDAWGFESVAVPGGDAPGVSSLCTGINNLGQVACATSNSADGTTIGLFVGTPRGP